VLTQVTQYYNLGNVVMPSPQHKATTRSPQLFTDTVTKRDGAWRITSRTITVRRKPLGRD